MNGQQPPQPQAPVDTPSANDIQGRSMPEIDLWGGPEHDVDGQLACGRMGPVLSAHGASIRSDVAMKVIRSNSSAHTHHVVRFFEQAQISGQLQHPNVVPA
jgi:serine/threonine-protein kinase